MACSATAPDSLSVAQVKRRGAGRRGAYRMGGGGDPSVIFTRSLGGVNARGTDLLYLTFCTERRALAKFLLIAGNLPVRQRRPSNPSPQRTMDASTTIFEEGSHLTGLVPRLKQGLKPNAIRVPLEEHCTDIHPRPRQGGPSEEWEKTAGVRPPQLNGWRVFWGMSPEEHSPTHKRTMRPVSDRRCQNLGANYRTWGLLERSEAAALLPAPGNRLKGGPQCARLASPQLAPSYSLRCSQFSAPESLSSLSERSMA